MDWSPTRGMVLKSTTTDDMTGRPCAGTSNTVSSSPELAHHAVRNSGLVARLRVS
jgi:hypothetical protein